MGAVGSTVEDVTTERDRWGEAAVLAAATPQPEPSAGATLHAVSSAVLAVTRHLSVPEVLQVIVRAAGRLLGARYAALGVPDDAGSFSEFVVEGVDEQQRRRIGPLPRQHGMLAVMLREGTPQRLPDIQRAPRFEGWPPAHPPLRDFLGVPIKDGEDVLGIIFLANKDVPGGFTEADEELLTLFAAHAAIALTNARLYERNRELTVMAERNRLARELHDAVSQKLFSLRLTARAALELAGGEPERATEQLAEVERLAGEALAELRSVIFELRPADLAGDGLAASLRKHAEVLGRVHRVRVRFAAETAAVALAERLPVQHETAVFRIAQEALQNALRHSGAGTVKLALAAQAGTLVLEVADDGVGLDPARKDGEGLGLASMRERAEAIGADLTITSADGTLIRMGVPVP